MKPIHLNLASRPYRDRRPVWAVIAVMGVLTAFLLVNNVETYYRYTHETRSTRTKIEQTEARAQRERQLAETAGQRLRNLDLKQLDARTKYINQRLSERAFSWSTLLDELESVLPRDVRLVAASPNFATTGPILVSLTLQSKSPNGMIETINRMHADPQFANPFPNSESVIEGGYSFDLRVDYLPPGQTAVLTEVSR